MKGTGCHQVRISVVIQACCKLHSKVLFYVNTSNMIKTSFNMSMLIFKKDTITKLAHLSKNVKN